MTRTAMPAGNASPVPGYACPVPGHAHTSTIQYNSIQYIQYRYQIKLRWKLNCKIIVSSIPSCVNVYSWTIYTYRLKKTYYIQSNLAPNNVSKFRKMKKSPIFLLLLWREWPFTIALGSRAVLQVESHALPGAWLFPLLTSPIRLG